MIGAPPKVMLHPQSAVRLRTVAEHIDANVAGRISWRRLVEAFRDSDEIRPIEEIEAFVLDDEGIQFYVRRR